MVGLLLTRPRPASERFAAGLPVHITNRMRVVVSPLVEILPGPENIDTEDSAGIVFSSSNGVGCAAQLVKSRAEPAYCVGEATTILALEHGWPARCVGSNANELVAQLLEMNPPSPLLHLRGAHTRGDIAARLSAGGVPCTERVVYDQALRPFNAEALDLLSGCDPVIAPVFSPRTARQFAKQCPDGANLCLIALSDAVAEPLKSLEFRHLSVCAKPDAQAMTHEVVRIGEKVQ